MHIGGFLVKLRLLHHRVTGAALNYVVSLMLCVDSA